MAKFCIYNKQKRKVASVFANSKMKAKGVYFRRTHKKVGMSQIKVDWKAYRTPKKKRR